MKTYLRKKAKLAMAIFPERGGFGFAVFKDNFKPLDWGGKSVKGNKNYQSLKKIAAMLTWYAPHVLVLEDHKGKGSRKSKRVQSLLRSIAVLARVKGIKVMRYSRKQIRRCFQELSACTKQEIAQAIATSLPVFKPDLPRERKFWMAVDERMKVFDAISLIFTYFYFNEGTLQVS